METINKAISVHSRSSLAHGKPLPIMRVRTPPLSLNTESLFVSRLPLLAVAVRQPQAAAPPIPSPEQDRHTQQQIVLTALQKLGINGVRAEDLQKLNPSNRYEEELALMGEVRAYFKIAYNVRQ